MRIQALIPPDRSSGYGRMAHEIVAALERAGVTVDPYDLKDKNPAPYVIFMCPPQRPENWYEGQHVSLLTMWESTELAFEHLAVLPLFDNILVPSQQNLEMFSQVNENTHKITLGLDQKVWKYTERKYSDPFTVITAGMGARRKGFDVSLKVFKRFKKIIEDEGYPTPRLIIKAKVNLSNPDPSIIVLDERLTDKEEAELYAGAHVYLGLSRGEGWGMIPHQTIAQGMPTILTDAHGHAEFSKYGIGISHGYCKAENEIVGRTGEWWEPDEEEALLALLDVFRNYDRHLEQAKVNAEKIKEFTWDRTAKEILATLPKKPDNLPVGELIHAPQSRLTLRVTKPIACNIGAGTYDFKPGQDYQVTSDVKRVLYDAGYVDPSCVDKYEKAIYITVKPYAIDQGTRV